MNDFVFIHFTEWMKSLLTIMELYSDVLSSMVVLKAGAQREFYSKRVGKKLMVPVNYSYRSNNPNQIN